MAKTIHDIETKVNNDGATPQGRLTASDFNVVVSAVQNLDKRNIVLTQEEYETLEQSGMIDDSKIYMITED